MFRCQEIQRAPQRYDSTSECQRSVSCSSLQHDTCCHSGIQKQTETNNMQAAVAGVFEDIQKNTCPHCDCIQPKVKLSGKHTFTVQPLGLRHEAKNQSLGIDLECAPA